MGMHWFKNPTQVASGQQVCKVPSLRPRCWRRGGRQAAPVPQNRYILGMQRPLKVANCRSLCSWAETGEQLEREKVFGCETCGSEWVASEAWTPIDSSGVIPDAVHEERRRGRG